MSTVLGPETGYVDILNHMTEERAAKESSNAATKYRPIRPSAAGKCTRELYYELMEYFGQVTYPKKPRTAESQRVLNLGHNIEYHLIQQFGDIKELFDIRYKQQVLSFEYLPAKKHPEWGGWLEGSIDLVLWSDKYKCVADVKSKGDSYDYQAKKSRWDSTSDKLASMSSVSTISANAYYVDNLRSFLQELADPFFAANFLQLNLYANADFLTERGVNHAAVIQYNKANSKLREVRFKPCPELYKETINKFSTALQAADTGDDRKATRDFEEGSFKCRYCPFEKTCWKKNKK